MQHEWKRKNGENTPEWANTRPYLSLIGVGAPHVHAGVPPTTWLCAFNSMCSVCLVVPGQSYVFNCIRPGVHVRLYEPNLFCCTGQHARVLTIRRRRTTHTYDCPVGCSTICIRLHVASASSCAWSVVSVQLRSFDGTCSVECMSCCLFGRTCSIVRVRSIRLHTFDVAHWIIHGPCCSFVCAHSIVRI